MSTVKPRSPSRRVRLNGVRGLRHGRTDWVAHGVVVVKGRWL